MSADPFKNAIAEVDSIMREVDRQGRISILAYAEFVASRYTEKCNRPLAQIIPLPNPHTKKPARRRKGRPAQ